MIRRVIAACTLVFFCLFLSGCTNGISVTQAQLNEAIKKEIAQGKEHQIALGLKDNGTLDMTLKVQSVQLNLTEKDGGMALVDMECLLSGKVNAFGQSFTFSTQVKPSLSSGVRLEENRIYLVSPRITNIEVYGSKFSDQLLRSTLGSLNSDLKKALTDYFNQHPVYVLNHNLEQKLAASMVKNITIKKNELLLGLF